MAFDLQAGYNTGEYSDITLLSAKDGTEFKVHKFIVTSASPTLKQLISNTNQLSMLALHESGPVLDTVLRFIYGHPIDVLAFVSPGLGEHEATVDEDGLANYAQICAAAEKYQVPGLSDCILQQSLDAIPPIDPDSRLTIAAALCGDSLRGMIVRGLLESVADDGLEVVDPVTKAPRLSGTSENITVQSRTPKVKPGIGQGSGNGPLTKNMGSAARETSPEDGVHANTPQSRREMHKKRGAKRNQVQQGELDGHARGEILTPAPDTLAEIHCLCGTHSSDQGLLQCDKCDKWYHPSCIGKSLYSAETCTKSLNWVRPRDVGHYKNKRFLCHEC
ncbi:hypothetical protein LTR17_023874 [Elasticomyces elasticus]|nr:hypothetical protein LTR17_023874 [Elasticomyces elasticus]